MKRRKSVALIAIFLVISLYFSMIPRFESYAATTKEKLEQKEQEHKETQNKINDTKQNIDKLSDVKDDLQGELNSLNAQLEEVCENLEQLEKKIEDKKAEIEQTQADLEQAKETETTQYETMKKRIKFIYEKRDSMYTDMLLSSEGFGDFLNKNSYIMQLSEYDRKMLAQYKETREGIELMEATLQKEKEDLDAYHEEVVAEQEKVTGYVNSTSSSIKKYAGQIKDAEAQQAAFEAQAAQEEQDIAELKKKLAEEIAMSKLAAMSSWRDISEITFEENDRYLLANLIYCEAGNQPYEGQVAVGAVVINRVRSSVYPNTVVGVIYQNRQFSPVGSGRLALALAENRATDACYRAADAAMQGVTTVGDCVYFRTPIEGLTGIQIGGHIFY